MNEWAIVAGSTVLTETTQDTVVRGIKQVIIHEKYNRTFIMHDIAVMELDSPVECNSAIQIACLAGPSVKLSELKNCYVAGWGDTYVKGKCP